MGALMRAGRLLTARSYSCRQYTTPSHGPGLVYSLPGLSTTEQRYLELQLAAARDQVDRTDLKAGFGERVRAVAEAYSLTSSKQVEAVQTMVNADMFRSKRVVARKFDMHQTPLAARGLELGDLLDSSPQSWIETCQKNKGDWRFGYGRTLKVMAERKIFQPAYKEKLLGVIESLGLQELEPVVAGWEESSFAQFSEEFHSIFLSEYCGVQDKKFLDKWHKKLKFRWAGALLEDKDPVNLLRTYFLLKEVLDMDLETNLVHISLLTRLSALEACLALNMLDGALFKEISEEERKDRLSAAAPRLLNLLLENQLIWSLSIPHCVDILARVGFTQRELETIMLQSENHLLTEMINKIVENGGKVESYIKLMRSRLELLEVKGLRLGIADACGKYDWINNWESVRDAFDKTEIQNNPVFIRFLPTLKDSKKVKINTNPSRQHSASMFYLIRYFDLNSHPENLKKFNAEFKKVPHAKDVPLRIVVDSLLYLEGLNFSKEQLEQGFPVLFYSKNILSENISKANATLGDSWKEKDNALCLLNYVIEVDDMFSFDLIFMGINEYYKDGLSPNFFNDLSDSCPSPSSPTKKVFLKAGVESGRRALLHTSASRCKDEEHNPYNVTTFTLQNPVTLVKNWLQLRELRQWDPSIEQEQLLDGARHAAAAISHKLADGTWQELRGLLSKKEHRRLQREVETEWSDLQRRLVRLEPEDILHVLLKEIRLQTIVQKKYCDVDLLLVGVRKEPDTPVLLQVSLRLHREYTDGCLPDWLVTKFSVTFKQTTKEWVYKSK